MPLHQHHQLLVIQATTVGRVLVLTVALLTLRTHPARAQTTVDDLRSPSTAAVTILGTAPTAIERPDTPRALVFNLASSVADAGGIPQNYAMQVAPYWLRSHPDLLFSNYVRPTVGHSIKRSFAVSVATADWSTGSGKSAEDLGSRLALGFSTVVVPGTLDPAFDALARKVQEDDLKLIDLLRQRATDPRLIALRATRDDLRSQLSSATDAAILVKTYVLLTDTEAALARITGELDAQVTKLQSSIVNQTKALQAMQASRRGLSLGVAGAWSVQIPGDVIQDSQAEQTGFWVTPSYRGRIRLGPKPAGDTEPESADEVSAGHALSGVGVFRYLRNRTDDSNTWDVGGRAIFEVSSAISVSGELLGRFQTVASVSQNTLRAVAVVEAKLADKTYLFASFGRGFTDNEQQRSLVSIIGINLGFGQKPVVTMDK
jgi:hypothetical protein